MATVTLGTNPTGGGMQYVYFDGGGTFEAITPVTHNGVETLSFVGYMHFAVDDSVLFHGQPADPIDIEVEYWDEGQGSFCLTYDSFAAAHDGCAATWTAKGNTASFQTVRWHLTDWYFGNRQDQGCDFRLACNYNAAQAYDIRRVTIFQPVQ